MLNGQYGGKVRLCARSTGIDHGVISRWRNKGAESVQYLRDKTRERINESLLRAARSAESGDVPDPDDDVELVGAFLDVVLEEKFDGQFRECSRKTGIHHSTISRWAKQWPDIQVHGHTYQKAREALGFSVVSEST